MIWVSWSLWFYSVDDDNDLYECWKFWWGGWFEGCDSKIYISKFDMKRLLGYIWDKGNSEKKVFHFQCCQTFSVNFSLENDLSQIHRF